MEPIRRDEILSADAYERSREAIRRRILALKQRRRVTLGEHATLHFESRETVLYQVHEMLRAEGSWLRPGAVEGEIDAYNPLVPAADALSATLMLEYDDPGERRPRLEELVGLRDHLRLHVGDAPPVQAAFDRAPASEARISAVQYVTFALGAERARLVQAAGTVLRVVADHPAYRAQAVLGEDTRLELARDLTGGGAQEGAWR